MHKTPRIALVYDRVNTTYGGAEHVLAALHQLFPDAPLYTSVYNKQRASWANTFSVHSSFLQRFPLAQKFHRQYVALMPLAFESFELDEYDIVISITSAEAKGILTKPHQLHICYLLTPTRYLWSHAAEYTQNWLIEQVKKPLFNYLRWWDQAAAQRPDIFIPIARRVAERCRQYYGRTTTEVIYPPVETEHFSLEPEPLPSLLAQRNIEPGSYYLIVARNVGYKKIDIAMKACAKFNRPLVVIGDGPDFKKLQKLTKLFSSNTPIVTVKSVQSSQLAAYYKNCRAFLAPGEEDFGIAAIEANACGKPAILHRKSGNAEISPDGVASIQIEDAEVQTVIKAMMKCETLLWDAKKIRSAALSVSTDKFQTVFHQRVMDHWQAFCETKTLPTERVYVR